MADYKEKDGDKPPGIHPDNKPPGIHPPDKPPGVHPNNKPPLVHGITKTVRKRIKVKEIMLQIVIDAGGSTSITVFKTDLKNGDSNIPKDTGNTNPESTPKQKTKT